MSPQVHRSPISRRQALKSLASGFGYVAFASLAHTQAARASSGQVLAPRPTHFPARAKRVIFLCMNGGPSHVDTFDYKPRLNTEGGQPTPVGRERGGARLLASPFQFRQHGESGMWISEVFPEVARHADELCCLYSMHTDLPNHSQAYIQLHTGSFQFTRPSMGAWTLYGLGTENTDLPGFVTLNPPSDNGGARNYGSGFLPTVCQGTRIGTNQIPGFYAALLGIDQEPGPPLRNLDNPLLPRSLQREQLDFVQMLNRSKLQQEVHHPEIEGAIESFELAFRMQDAVPGLLEIQSEPASIQRLYGIGSGLPTDRFGRQCLMARRLVEAGVRFVEVTSGGWDHHFFLKDKLAECALGVDQPIAALLTDLRQRGLLDETLVIWGGEFGRTPYAQSGNGRDHNNKGFTLWMAGGGVKGGCGYGATDEYGYQAVDRPVHIHDWHATLLHLLGLDHERLTFNYAGRDFRLTDVYGNVVHDILA